MNESSTVAERKIRSLAIGIAFGSFFLPWWAMTWAGVEQFQDWPAAAAPFGLNRILMAHLLAALPFCFWMSWRVSSILKHQLAFLICIGVGVLLALVSLRTANQIAETIVLYGGGFNLLWRTLWVVVLAIPWCLATVFILKNKLGIEKPFWSDGLTASLLLVVPFVYSDYVIERQSILLRHSLVMEQYSAALKLTEKLAVIGSQPLLEQPSATLLEQLQATVSELEASVSKPLPDDPSRQQLLQRAQELFSLGQFEPVKQLVGPRANVDPMASYRLALTLEAEGQSAAAADQYRTTVRLIEANQSPAWMPLLRISIEHLVNNLRRSGDYAAAEDVLLGGLNESPELRDTFLLQLGYHYSMAGRTSEAVDFFEQAGEANPEMRKRTEAEISKMNHQAAGCLLRAAPAASR